METLTRRERKKQETREALQAAALRLFSERGFANTTVEDITEEVDVARRTFFRYFESKEAALFARADELEVLLQTELAARPGDESLLDGVHIALKRLADAQLEHQETHLARARISMTTPEVKAAQLSRREAWNRVVADWARERLETHPGDLRPDLIAATTMGALGAAMQHWVDSDGAADPTALVDEAFDLLRHGGCGLHDS